MADSVYFSCPKFTCLLVVDELVGEYPLPEYGWGEAGVVAETRARLLGYRVHRESMG